MKRCPSCQRTYDDTQAFCSIDGVRLIEEGPAYNSQRTLVAPPPAQQQREATPYYRQEQPYEPSSPYETQTDKPPSWPQPGGGSNQRTWPLHAAVTTPQQAPGWEAPQPQYPAGAPFAQAGTAAVRGKRRGLAIAALQLGILSIQNAIFATFLWFRPYSPIHMITLLMAFAGLIMGAVALTLSVTNAARHAGRALATAGIITGLISIILIFLRGQVF